MIVREIGLVLLLQQQHEEAVEHLSRALAMTSESHSGARQFDDCVLCNGCAPCCILFRLCWSFVHWYLNSVSCSLGFSALVCIQSWRLHTHELCLQVCTCTARCRITRQSTRCYTPGHSSSSSTRRHANVLWCHLLRERQAYP